MRKYKGSPRQMVVEWIAALRSGEYEQGSGRLRDMNNKYCCLGVLSDVSVAHITPPIQDTAWNFDEYREAYLMDGAAFSIPFWLAEHIGVTFKDARRLMQMNDIDNLSFSQIADYIESEILPCIKE